MLNEPSPVLSDDFLSDLVSGRKDILALGVDHALSEQMLSHWIQSPTNVQFLAGLIRLADMQTQLLISRCRSHAVSRLAAIASDRDEKSETARRAAVDLLKLDLRGAAVNEHALQNDDDDLIPTPEELYGSIENGSENPTTLVASDTDPIDPKENQ